MKKGLVEIWIVWQQSDLIEDCCILFVLIPGCSSFICKQPFPKAVKPGRIFLFASKRAVHCCLLDKSSDHRTHCNRIIILPAPRSVIAIPTVTPLVK
uniref:Uncharacterized protein n=1 Tax=Romanomermis culicivorax TaxID=13658 RepID=A0A915K8N5_ROMCU